MIRLLIGDANLLVRAGIKAILTEAFAVTEVGEGPRGAEVRCQPAPAPLEPVCARCLAAGARRAGDRTLRSQRTLPDPAAVSQLPLRPPIRGERDQRRRPGLHPPGLQPEDLLAAVRTMLDGGCYVSPQLSDQLLAHSDDDRPSYARLSQRELQIFRKLALGAALTRDQPGSEHQPEIGQHLPLAHPGKDALPQQRRNHPIRRTRRPHLTLLPKELAVKLTRAIYPLIVAATVLAACSSAESDWKKADSQNTTAAYQDFLTQHPNDTHAQEARDRIKKLEDDQAWADAQKTNTADGYQQYLQKEPNGTHAQEAHDQVAALERAADWKTAQQANTVAALQGFLQKYSQGPEVDEAKAALDKLQGYRVSSAPSRMKSQLRKRMTICRSASAVTFPVSRWCRPTGTEKRHVVASGPMTEDDAKAACAKLKKAHAHCEVVKR